MTHTASAGVLGVVLAAGLALPTGAAAPPAGQRAALHVLNRLAFGPRPGDVERVLQIGVPAYIDEQLHPERLADARMAERLQGFTTLGLSSRQIAERYEIPALQARRDRKEEAANSPNPETAPSPTDMKRMDPDRAEANRPLAELAQQKILRAAYSDRQLQEVLTDVWFNHFNVDARKGPSRFMLTEYERDVIRPRVLGRFRDLLGATAKSPAMLFYLDNWMSAAPNSPHLDGSRRAIRRQARPNMPKGLNENYGRELLELHTLGVDGGYTQKDVTEVARAFTGWSIANPRLGGGFRFVPALHDDGEKVVLGHTIKAGGGERDGERVLDLLASHPSTARFIVTTLARRFVSDTPPPTLVERATATFRQTDGDLRAVMTVLLTSPEFLAPEAYRAKVKTPFEFLISALRVTAADIVDARPLVRAMQQLGMPLYQCQPPTGYKDTAGTWVNAGALVNRMNVAQSLASSTMPGVRVRQIDAPGASAGEAAAESVGELIGELSETTRATIAKATTQPQAIALALGSPEFQRR